MSAEHPGLWKVRQAPLLSSCSATNNKAPQYNIDHRGRPQTLVLPPIFALLLYLLATYLVMPYYRRFRSNSSYTLLPSSLAPSNSPTSAAFAHGLLSRVNALLGGSARRVSGDSLMGDEELEEGGFANLDDALTVGRVRADARSNINDGERRLTRELERGFRDSSDEDDDDRRRVGR